ncbi:31091_t:CDS:2, partial [Racocetra persica]
RTNSNNENSDDPADSPDNDNPDDPDEEYEPIARSNNFPNKAYHMWSYTKRVSTRTSLSTEKQKEVVKEGAEVDKEKQKEVSKERAEVDKEKQKEVGKKEAEIDKGKQKEIVEPYRNLSLISEGKTSRVPNYQESNISVSDVNYQDSNADDTEIIETLANTEIFLQCLLELEEPEEQEKE